MPQTHLSPELSRLASLAEDVRDADGGDGFSCSALSYTYGLAEHLGEAEIILVSWETYGVVVVACGLWG
jgi:hypothetical protein